MTAPNPPRHRWALAGLTVAVVAIGFDITILNVALLAGFAWWELRVRERMIDLKLFRDRQFRWGSINATLASFTLFGLLFIAPRHLQFVLGLDAFDTGLRLLPLIVGLVAGAGAATRVAARTGHRMPIVAGLLVTAAAVAEHLRLPSIAEAANSAYINAMVSVLIACATVAAAGAVATMLFMPRRSADTSTQPEQDGTAAHTAGHSA